MSKNTMKWTFGLLIVGCLLAIAAPAGAELIQQDSADFDWCYEMDAKPSAEDLDTNLTMDFTEVGSGMSVLNGVLTIGGATYTRYFESSPAALQIWPQQAYSHVTGYTFEIKLKMDPDVAEGSKGVMLLGAGPVNAAADTAWMCIKKADMIWYDAVNGYHSMGVTDNNADGGWHTFRVAQEPNSGAVGGELFSVWRDDVLVASGMPGTHLAADFIKFGDLGNMQAGTVYVDYFRFTGGAYAPIPEPGTLALLATGLIGLLCYAWRKQK